MIKEISLDRTICDNEVLLALDIAKEIAKENQNPYYAGSHLLKAMLARDLSLIKDLESIGVDIYYLEEWAEVRIEEEVKITRRFSCEPDKTIHQISWEARSLRDEYNDDKITLFHFFVALSSPGVAFNFDQIKSFPISRNELLEKMEALWIINSKGGKKNDPSQISFESYIQKYCIDKKQQIQENQQREFLIGRELEIQDMVEILCRLNRPNILLLGDHGIGKTALLEGFIQKVLAKQVPDSLSDLEIFQLDLSAFIAGASYKGEMEDRFRHLSKEIRKYPKAVLIIEELHVLLGNDNLDSGMGNILKNELARGLILICSSTIEQYTKKIEKDQGLVSMFEKLKLYEKDDDTQLRILESRLEDYQAHYTISMDNETMKEAVRLSRRYMKEKSLPASAINLIDHTMSTLKTSEEMFFKEREAWIAKISILENEIKKGSGLDTATLAKWLLGDLINKFKYLIHTSSEFGNEEVMPEYSNVDEILLYVRSYLERIEKVANEKRSQITAKDLAWTIYKRTNIPIGKLKNEERNKLQEIESVLSRRVIGQAHAISSISGSILESRSGLSKGGQPIGSFFFSGPTGTGKTELAKSLAEFLFQDEKAIIRFDMSEFKEEHSAALLYGAPPGYVGYEEGGLLVNEIRKKPYSIVLFDEIEKAHPAVFDVFLQIMDEGKLHDRLGREGDFSNAILLFTSNIGSDFIMDSFQKGDLPESSKLLEIMASYFRPEFLARLTEIIPFAPIRKDDVLKIFDIHLKKELLDQAKGLDIDLSIGNKVKDFLCSEGYDIKYGARPIKGIIRSHLRRPLAKKIISGVYKEGDKIVVDLQNNKLIWEKQ